jgi:hypothetical protein
VEAELEELTASLFQVCCVTTKRWRSRGAERVGSGHGDWDRYLGLVWLETHQGTVGQNASKPGQNSKYKPYTNHLLPYVSTI